MGLLHYVLLLAVVLFITVSLSSCNASANIVLNEKELVLEKLKGLHVPKSVSLISDTSKVEEDKVDTISKKETTGDFRYDNMFK
jgi:hypothetical protein